MTWNRGADTIRQLLDDGKLELVGVNPPFADRLVTEAETHLVSADRILADDPPGAFQLAYDAARKACEGLLAVQGLRSTRDGGHVAVADAVRDQFNGKGGKPAFGNLNRIRRERHSSEYPTATTPPITHDDATALIADAKEIVEAARVLLDKGVLSPFETK